jgi:hypothetical protein
MEAGLRNLARWMLAALLAAAPAAAAAQAPDDRAPEPGGVEAGAFQLLRDHRDELGITSAQAARLHEIAERLQVANQPLREQLAQRRAAFLAQRRAALVRMTPEQRRAELARIRARGGEVPADWRPLLERMRANQRAAMGQAQAVLTLQQKARARGLVREWRQERERERAERRHAARARAHPGAPRP